MHSLSRIKKIVHNIQNIRLTNKRKALAIASRFALGFFIAGIAVLMLFVLNELLFNPSKATFNVVAETEIVELKIINKNQGRFTLYNCRISDYENTLLDSFYGTLQLLEGTIVRIERTGTANPVITLSNPENKGELCILYHENADIIDRKWGHDLSIEYLDFHNTMTKNGFNLFLNLEGILDIGKNINRPNLWEPPALLREGIISVVGRSIIGNYYYESGEHKLYIGDQLVFYQNLNTYQDSIDNKGIGFVLIDTVPGMHLAYRVNAYKAKIFKTGPKTKTSSYDISVSIIDQILLDRIFQGFSIVSGALLISINILTFYLDYSMFSFARKEDKRRRKKYKALKSSASQNQNIDDD